MSSDKVWENRLRRVAARQGYQLKKNPRRDPRALDYGTWRLTDLTGRRPDSTRGQMTLQQVASYLGEC